MYLVNIDAFFFLPPQSKSSEIPDECSKGLSPTSYACPSHAVIYRRGTDLISMPTKLSLPKVILSSAVNGMKSSDNLTPPPRLAAEQSQNFPPQCFVSHLQFISTVGNPW